MRTSVWTAVPSAGPLEDAISCPCCTWCRNSVASGGFMCLLGGLSSTACLPHVLRARTKGTGCVIGYIKGAIQKGVWLATPFLARPPKARWSFVHMYFLIYHRNIIWSRRCGIEVRGELSVPSVLFTCSSIFVIWNESWILFRKMSGFWLRKLWYKNINLQEVGGFIRVLRFPPQVILTFYHHHLTVISQSVSQSVK